VVAPSSASSPLSSLMSTTGSESNEFERVRPVAVSGFPENALRNQLIRQRVGLLVAFRSGDREWERDREGRGLLDSGGGFEFG
jgi:hypothetical protein